MKRILSSFLSALWGFLLTSISAYVLFLESVSHIQMLLAVIMCAFYVYKDQLSALSSALSY
jgi:hypothetical protein